ncbi:TetR/AcrR family transcriptional regulator [Cohnella sp. 56]|uniref:TetR/AcrR family transcriptional regulator n=1 Tax=Cohnella sp. 56 TaxID=3113722 RepID=UPI0030E913B6
MEQMSSFQTILQATEALIHEKGCRQTTLQDILKKTGLSKGAIYHYVTGKDELLGLVLKSRIEQMNERFMNLVNDPATIGLENPLQLIATGFVRTSQPEDVTNKIFIYLLSQMDNAAVAVIMHDVYEYTRGVCERWIEVGQQSGVIPLSIDRRRVATRLLTYMYGMRMYNTIRPAPDDGQIEEVMAFMMQALRS